MSPVELINLEAGEENQKKLVEESTVAKKEKWHNKWQ